MQCTRTTVFGLSINSPHWITFYLTMFSLRLRSKSKTSAPELRVKPEVDGDKKMEQFFNEYYAEFPLSKNEVRESRKLTKKTLERRRRKAQTMQIANYGTRDKR